MLLRGPDFELLCEKQVLDQIDEVNFCAYWTR
jgi:hypothetical protein